MCRSLNTWPERGPVLGAQLFSLSLADVEAVYHSHIKLQEQWVMDMLARVPVFEPWTYVHRKRLARCLEVRDIPRDRVLYRQVRQVS